MKRTPLVCSLLFPLVFAGPAALLELAVFFFSGRWPGIWDELLRVAGWRESRFPFIGGALDGEEWAGVETPEDGDPFEYWTPGGSTVWVYLFDASLEAFTLATFRRNSDRTAVRFGRIVNEAAGSRDPLGRLITPRPRFAPAPPPPPRKRDR